MPKNASAVGYLFWWDAEAMLGGIEGIMGLAAASGEDLGTTSDIVTDSAKNIIREKQKEYNKEHKDFLKTLKKIKFLQDIFKQKQKGNLN